MAINKRERNLLVITVSLMLLGLNYFLVAPLLQSWQKLGGDLTQRHRQFDAESNTIARIPEWQTDYEKLGRGLKQSEHFEAVSDVLKKIDEIGKVAGILPQSSKPLKPEEHDVYREWPVQYSFESTTESLVRFLVGLQSSSSFMTVEQLSVAAKPDNTGILRCDIQIRALAAKGGNSAL